MLVDVFISNGKTNRHLSFILDKVNYLVYGFIIKAMCYSVVSQSASQQSCLFAGGVFQLGQGSGEDKYELI